MIRPATPADVDALVDLFRALATFEKLSTQIDRDALSRHLFGPRPFAEALVAEVDGRIDGYALFFHTYSTFLSKPGVWLEDLFVRESARGRGLGLALLTAVKALAVQRGCGRVEWSVLDWNTKAIAFYETFGATALSEWKLMRVNLSSPTTT